MPNNPNDTSDVGPDKTYVDVTKKYDAEHGKYQSNVPLEPNLPNANPAGPNPSPYKIGQ